MYNNYDKSIMENQPYILNFIYITIVTINTDSQKNAQASEKLVYNAENIANLSEQLNEIVSFFKLGN